MAAGKCQTRRLNWLSCRLTRPDDRPAGRRAAGRHSHAHRPHQRTGIRDHHPRQTHVPRPLLALPGVAGPTAAKIVGETANVTRFRFVACLAMHTSAAPIPARPDTPNGTTWPARQPATQRGTAPHRRHPTPRHQHPRTRLSTLRESGPEPLFPEQRQRLLPAQTRQRRHQSRSPTRAETPRRPHHLQTPRPPTPTPQPHQRLDIGATHPARGRVGSGPLTRQTIKPQS